MPFSDDDLKQLKEMCESPYTPMDLREFRIGAIQAFLARLEAAEDIAENGCDCHYIGPANFWKCQRHKIWCKTAGKNG